MKILKKIDLGGKGHRGASGQLPDKQEVECPHCDSTLTLDKDDWCSEQYNMVGGGLVYVTKCLACGFRFGFDPQVPLRVVGNMEINIPECYAEIANQLADVLEGPLRHQRTKDYFLRMAKTQRAFRVVQMEIVENLEERITVLEESYDTGKR